MISALHFTTLQEAWEQINLRLAYGDKEILKGGGGAYGTEFISYNVLAMANTALVDPEFDFGAVLGYTIKKWTTLIKNYVDFDYLDLLKSEITSRRGKNAKSYNYAFHFSNKYGGGKDCLLSLVFSKRVGADYPTVFFNVRVSEVTSRLLFDFLLVQRICEYVYGVGYPVEIHFYAPSLFITAERFSMFARWYGWKEIKQNLSDEKFPRRIKEVYRHFKTTDVSTIKYQVHKRCAEVVQRIGHKIAQPLKAKDMKLIRLIPNLPEDVVTPKDMRLYKKENNLK